jgi:ABC-type Fe3+/spermidine/putrescine transport system ATPase subunit
MAGNGNAAALEVDRARKTYGAVVAADDVSLTVGDGEFVTLLGPSGSGKTTTLRLVGGFERPDGGQIRIRGVRVDHLPPYARDTATVFQTGALFPHKTVRENVAYGLRMRGVPKPEMEERVPHALDIVRLQGLEDRYPGQLSGGQKQRVALARSLVVRPAIVLFDEPLSALDLSLRLQLRGEIKRLHHEIGFSAVYVTHDQSEAMAMSNRVAVMNRGRIDQIDTPERIFHHPASEFVFTFIGESCCMPVRIDNGSVLDRQGQSLAMHLAATPGQGDWRLYVRPTRLKLGPAADSCDNSLNCQVSFVEFLGETYRYHLKAGELDLFADHAGRGGFDVGHQVTVGWQSADMAAFA